MCPLTSVNQLRTYFLIIHFVKRIGEFVVVISKKKKKLN